MAVRKQRVRRPTHERLFIQNSLAIEIMALERELDKEPNKEQNQRTGLKIRTETRCSSMPD